MGVDNLIEDPGLRAAYYALPPTLTVGRLRARLRRHFSGVSLERHGARIILCDSFDWRLVQRGWLGICENALLRVVELQSDRELAAWSGETRLPPRFWWQYPDSNLKELLCQTLDVRALLPRLQVVRNTVSLNLLDGEQKTVARIALETLAAAPGEAAFETLRGCRLMPIRGYDEQRQQAEEALSGLGLEPLPEHGLVIALRRAGLQPGGYSTKPTLPLTPELTSSQAGWRILARLAEIMAINVDGILADVDSECLHDLRVASRRARSLLTLLKNAFDPQQVAPLKLALRQLGQVTNALRDTDVYLLRQSDYQALLPPSLRPAIAPLFGSLQQQRGQQLEQVSAYLSSSAFRSALRRMRARGVRGRRAGAAAMAADVPIIDTARRAIARRFRRVLQSGRQAVGVQVADDVLHRLRIECKKLRYALEFFAALFPREQMGLLVAQLKALQDRLGRINDLAVQQRFLDGFVQSLATSHQPDLALAAAVGALIGALYQDQSQERQRLGQSFAQFAAKDNRRLYRRLFAPRESAA